MRSRAILLLRPARLDHDPGAPHVLDVHWVPHHRREAVEALAHVDDIAIAARRRYLYQRPKCRLLNLQAPTLAAANVAGTDRPARRVEKRFSDHSGHLTYFSLRLLKNITFPATIYLYFTNSSHVNLRITMTFPVRRCPITQSETLSRA